MRSNITNVKSISTKPIIKLRDFNQAKLSTDKEKLKNFLISSITKNILSSQAVSAWSWGNVFKTGLSIFAKLGLGWYMPQILNTLGAAAILGTGPLFTIGCFAAGFAGNMIINWITGQPNDITPSGIAIQIGLAITGAHLMRTEMMVDIQKTINAAVDQERINFGLNGTFAGIATVFAYLLPATLVITVPTLLFSAYSSHLSQAATTAVIQDRLANLGSVNQDLLVAGGLVATLGIALAFYNRFLKSKDIKVAATIENGGVITEYKNMEIKKSDLEKEIEDNIAEINKKIPQGGKQLDLVWKDGDKNEDFLAEIDKKIKILNAAPTLINYLNYIDRKDEENIDWGFVNWYADNVYYLEKFNKDLNSYQFSGNWFTSSVASAYAFFATSQRAFGEELCNWIGKEAQNLFCYKELLWQMGSIDTETMNNMASIFEKIKASWCKSTVIEYKGGCTEYGPKGISKKDEFGKITNEQTEDDIKMVF